MLLNAQALAKSLGQVKVLTDANLQINEGDSIGSIGTNGAGKRFNFFTNDSRYCCRSGTVSVCEDPIRFRE